MQCAMQNDIETTGAGKLKEICLEKAVKSVMIKILWREREGERERERVCYVCVRARALRAVYAVYDSKSYSIYLFI